MLYILGVSCAFSIIFIIIMIAVCIKWCNSWWMVFLPLLGQPYGMCAYRVCVSGFVESNKMHLCATSAGSCLCGVHSHLAPWKYHVSLPNKLSVKWKELMFLSAIYILMTPSPLHLEPPEVSRSRSHIPAELYRAPPQALCLPATQNLLTWVEKPYTCPLGGPTGSSWDPSPPFTWFFSPGIERKQPGSLQYWAPSNAFLPLLWEFKARFCCALSFLFCHQLASLGCSDAAGNAWWRFGSCKRQALDSGGRTVRGADPSPHW